MEKVRHMKCETCRMKTFCAAIIALALASKGGSESATNGAPNSPEAQHPATGQQQTGQSSHSSSTHNQ
jgi:hypothetical protein